MSAASANTVGAIEMAVPAAAGGIAAAVAYRALLPDLMALPVADRAVFGADARPSVCATTAVILGVVTLASLLERVEFRLRPPQGRSRHLGGASAKMALI